MKYSILVLGASITLSLFIRICGAVETNALHKDKSESGIFSTLPVDTIPHSDNLFIGHEQMDFSNLEVNAFAEEIKRKHGIAYFNLQVCGISDPPNLELLPCYESLNCSRSIVDELPLGCVYDDDTNTTINCGGETLTDMPLLPDHLEITTFRLSNTKIQNISWVAFSNASVKTIMITNNNAIVGINPWAFHGVEGLTKLIITGNKLKFLSYEIYVGLNELEILNLQDNDISLEVYSDCPIIKPDEKIPIVLPNLKSLNLSGNPLTIIPPQMFAGLRESPLNSLYLDDCYLRHIHSDAFSYLTSLETLSLSENDGLAAAVHLPTILKNLTNLNTLRLKSTTLTEFPQELLAELPKLKVLDISDNQFYSIKFEHMSKAPNLKELKMDNCKIEDIEDNAFDANTELDSLSMLNNRIKQLPAHFPTSLTMLTVSATTSRNLARCQESSFHNLTHLTYLSLAGIQIDTISRFLFRDLESLKKAFLQNCGIQHIEDGAFQNSPDLNILDLSGNPISELSPETFSSLDNLKQLTLINCELSFPASITISPFKNLPNLQSLILSRNKIRKIPSVTFKNLKNMTTLNLSDNPIESWSERIIDEESTVYDLDAFLSLKVDLSNGKLRFITEAMAEDFLRMNNINLSGNEFSCDEGTCQLRDMIHNATDSWRQDYALFTEYRCSITKMKETYDIYNITDEICKLGAGVIDESTTEKGDESKHEPEPEHEPSDEDGQSESSSSVVKIITITGSVCAVAVVVLILAYRNRVHLRYFVFKAKLNVSPATNRKAKMSTTESAEYDYDVFISYHNEDSQFIADVFLPEIEQEESKLDEMDDNSSTVSTISSRNDIFFIESDQKSIISRSSSGQHKFETAKKFKVCLHERDFAAGVPITENIMDCVDRSRKMIIFVSKKYMESQWCSFEMNLVYHRLIESRRKSFALVLLEDIPTNLRSKVLNYLLITKTYLQWPGMNGSDMDKTSFWRRLRAFLQSPN